HRALLQIRLARVPFWRPRARPPGLVHEPSRARRCGQKSRVRAYLKLAFALHPVGRTVPRRSFPMSSSALRAVETPAAGEPSSRAWLRALELTGSIERSPTRTLPIAIAEWAGKTPDAPALLSDRERFTYSELVARSRRYARWALAQGVGKGEAVA